ncbi:hypothetical protein BJX76DRAFT_349736 [Aspergillus varians]
MYTPFYLALATLTSIALSSPLTPRDTVPTGQVIASCTTPNTIALTFDDGPSVYTSQLLDLLSRYNAHATFFVLGDSSQQYPELLQRMRSEGHQIGSHTYDHYSLPTLSYAEIVQQMTRLEDVLSQSVGVVPSYMRPPYFDVDDQVLQVMSDLGYKVIEASIDTKDYENNDEAQISNSYQKFVDELNAGGSIVLSHDIHYWTVASLVEQMLIESRNRGLTITTVGDCLGEPEAAWYK